jgi:hypothetical protein
MLAEGKVLREGWDSKELWKTVEKFSRVGEESGASCAVTLRIERTAKNGCATKTKMPA